MSSNKEFNVSLTRTAKHEEQICVRIDRNAYHAFMKKAMSEALGVEIGDGYKIEHQACDVQISWTVTKKDAIPAQFFNLIDPFNKQTPSPGGEHEISPAGISWNDLWGWIYSRYTFKDLCQELTDRGFVVDNVLPHNLAWEAVSLMTRRSLGLVLYEESFKGEHKMSPVGLTWNQLWRWLYSNYGYQELTNELLDRGFVLNASLNPKANWDRASKHVRESIAIDFYKQHGSPEQVELSREEKLGKLSANYSSAHAFQTMIRIEPTWLVGQTVLLNNFDQAKDVTICIDADFDFTGVVHQGTPQETELNFLAEDIEPMKDWDWTQKLKTSQVNALFTALK